MPTPSTARRLGALAAATLLAAVAATGAQAASGTDAVCTSLMSLQITPGFTIGPGEGAATSGGDTGTLICIGREYGHPITGPGTLGVVETYETPAGCLSDTSSGQVTATLPTTAGPVRIVGALTERRLGLVADIQIAFPQAHFSGTAVIVPTDGLCLFSPLVDALVSTSGTLFG